LFTQIDSQSDASTLALFPHFSMLKLIGNGRSISQFYPGKSTFTYNDIVSLHLCDYSADRYLWALSCDLNCFQKMRYDAFNLLYHTSIYWALPPYPTLFNTNFGVCTFWEDLGKFNVMNSKMVSVLFNQIKVFKYSHNFFSLVCSQKGFHAFSDVEFFLYFLKWAASKNV